MQFTWIPRKEIAKNEFSEEKRIETLGLEPYFGNPYDLKEKFSGRIEERKILSNWASGNDRPILVLTALGGMGKSSLAWVWMHNDVLSKPVIGKLEDCAEDLEKCRIQKENSFEGVLWWSFYEQEQNFDKFLDEALIYTNEKFKNDIKKLSINDKVKNLVDTLRKHRFLFILDGFERELRAYSTLNAAYQLDEKANTEKNLRRCIDLTADKFLRWLSGSPIESRILLISRLMPDELEGSTNCKPVELQGLDPKDAIKFFELV